MEDIPFVTLCHGQATTWVWLWRCIVPRGARIVWLRGRAICIAGSRADNIHVTIPPMDPRRGQAVTCPLLRVPLSRTTLRKRSTACPILKVWARPFALPVQHRWGNRFIRVLGVEILEEFLAIRYILGVILGWFIFVGP